MKCQRNLKVAAHRRTCDFPVEGASQSKGTGRRVKVALHRMTLTKCAKGKDRDRRRCAETKYCPRTLSAHKTKTWDTMTCQGDLDKIRMSRTEGGGLVLRKGHGPDAHDSDRCTPRLEETIRLPGYMFRETLAL